MIPWHIFSSIKIYPFYLAYFNEFIGNQKNADKYLIDSNLDWGQDGKRLAQWIEQNKIDQIYTDGVNNYYLKNKAIGINSQDATKSGYYAIGRHKYRLSTFYNQSSSWEQFAKNSQLITIIGNSIYIFKK